MRRAIAPCLKAAQEPLALKLRPLSADFKALHVILTSGAGSIVIFEEPAQVALANHDYASLCLKHGCRMHTFLRYPKPNGSAMYYLCLEGSKVDAFVRELWAMANQVVWTEMS